MLAHADQLREIGWRAVHVDFSRVADLTDVARRIASAYAALDPSWIRSHLSALLGRIGISLSPTGPTLTVGARPARGERSRIQYHGDAAAYVYAGSEPLSPDECLGDVVVFAGGHPQRTMLLAYLLADRLAAGEQATLELTTRVVDDAATRVAPRVSGAVAAGWRGRASRARGRCGRPRPDQPIAGRRAQPGTHNDERDRGSSRRQGHLLREAHGSRLVDPLLAEWVRRR